jgi:hypothetical protein
MKKNEIVILSLKLLGIYITAQGLSSFAATFGMNGFHGIDNWSLYFGFVIYLLSGLILIFKAGTISGFILPRDNSNVEKFEMPETFQKSALRIIGLYIAISSFPALVHISGKIVQYEFWGSEVPEYLKEKPYLIIPLGSFLLGVYLALGPSSVIKALGRFDKTIERMGT